MRHERRIDIEQLRRSACSVESAIDLVHGLHEAERGMAERRSMRGSILLAFPISHILISFDPLHRARRFADEGGLQNL